MVQDKLPDWKLTLVGDGPQFGTCRQIIAEKKLKRVCLTGHQMSIPYIDRARILCLTSVIEGLTHRIYRSNVTGGDSYRIRFFQCDL